MFHLNMRLLGDRTEGEQVNLERAMLAHVRFGGHFVQVCATHTTSHVDSFAIGSC